MPERAEGRQRVTVLVVPGDHRFIGVPEPTTDVVRRRYRFWRMASEHRPDMNTLMFNAMRDCLAEREDRVVEVWGNDVDHRPSQPSSYSTAYTT
jgi:hypothetical protein